MFKLSVEGADEFVATLDSMAEQIKELHEKVPETLIAWQLEDLGRKHPNIAVSHSGNRTTASTRIWRGPGAAPLKKRRRRFREKDWQRVREGVPEGGEFLDYIGPKRRRRRGGKRSRWWAKEGESKDPTTDPQVRNSLTEKMTALLEEPKWQPRT